MFQDVLCYFCTYHTMKTVTNAYKTSCLLLLNEHCFLKLCQFTGDSFIGKVSTSYVNFRLKQNPSQNVL